MGHFPYDAVVFDLDGTLFDAEEGIVSSVVKAMKEMGLEIPQGAQLRQVVGPPLRYSFHDLLNVPSERLDEAADRYAHIFRSEGMYRYSVYPGIRTMLRVLKENGIYVALASSTVICANASCVITASGTFSTGSSVKRTATPSWASRK